MSYYYFTKYPPGNLLIHFLKIKFSGIITLKESAGYLKIYFSKGCAAKIESDNIGEIDNEVEKALIYLFKEGLSGFEMEESNISLKGIYPFFSIKEGILKHYSKDRLFKEGKELLKAKVTLNKGYEPYIKLFRFSETELKIIDILKKSPVTLRDLSNESGSDLAFSLKMLYILTVSKLIKSAVETPRPELDTTGLDDDAIELLNDLTEQLEKIKDPNLFKRFGITKNATTSEIETLYKDKARKFHPDIITAKGLSKYREKAVTYFKILTETYNILKDPEERKKLNVEKVSPEEQAKIKKVLEAEMAYQKAMIHFRRKQYNEAEELMKTAVKNAPDDGSYLGLWAWIVYCNPENNRDLIRNDIKKALIEAVELTKRESNLHYYLGKVLADANQYEAAKQHLSKAVALNSENFEAEREIRLLNKKQSRNNSLLSKTGTFLKIFKK